MKKDGRGPKGGTAGSRPDETFLDDIQVAWRAERPDLDLAMAGTLLRLERANHWHKVRLEAISKAIGLQTGELYVLLALRRAGKPYELRPTDLFRALLVSSAAMTKRVVALQKGGFVVRVSASDDGRSELVRLTPKGRAAADRGISEISRVVEQVTIESGLTDQEIGVLDRCLRKLLSVKTIELPKELKKVAAKRRASQN
jgi:DNA-binding MarR family transcriptional regulator